MCKVSVVVADLPAEAVPKTSGWTRVTARSHIPSRCPTYSLTSWHTARDVVALKLDTIWGADRRVSIVSEVHTHTHRSNYRATVSSAEAWGINTQTIHDWNTSTLLDCMNTLHSVIQSLKHDQGLWKESVVNTSEMRTIKLKHPNKQK